MASGEATSTAIPSNRSLASARPSKSNEDCGRTAVWLASDLSSAVTGETIYVDGGFNVMGVPLLE